MIRRTGRWQRTCAAAFFAGTFATAVSAEDSSGTERDALEQKYGVLEEVVSTARKREEPLQDTPVASTVLQGQALDLRFYTDLKSAEFPAPNVNITSIGAFSNGIVATIRGVVNGDPDSTIDPPVALFVDGVYLARPAASSLDMFDIEQVEILRGPQGTLFGRNTSAGAIQLRTRRPSGEFGSRGKVMVGDYGRMDIRAAVDIPVNDIISAKVAVMSQNMDGYYRSTLNGRDLGREDITAIRPVIQITPNDRLDLTFIGEFHRNKSDPKPQQNETPANKILCALHGFCGFPLGEGDEFRVAAEDPGFIDAEIKGLTAELNYQFDPGILTWVSNYRETKEDLVYDPDAVVYPLFGVDRRQPHEQYSTELRFASTAFERFDFVAGVFLFHQEYDLERVTSLAITAPTPITRNLSITGQEHDAFSVFGELNYYLTEALTITVGGRYTDEEKDFYQRPFAPFPNTGPRTDQDDSWSDFGPKFGLQYRFTPDLMTYFTYQKGFKSGGFNGRCGQPATCEKSYDPEEVEGFEVGMKAEFWDNRVRTNLAVFYNEYTDLQRTGFVPLLGAANPQEAITENAGDATISGAELELTALLFEGFQLDLALGYLDTEYDEYCADVDGAQFFDQAPAPQCGEVIQATGLDVPGGPGTYLVDVDNSDQPFTRAPELNYSVTANYGLRLGNGGYLNFNGRYTWTDDLFIDADDGVKRDDTELLDASISYEDPEGRYRVTLFGKNLTDEVYLEGKTDLPGLFTTRVVNQPRRYGVEFAWDL